MSETKPKFVVICGPDLKNHDSQILELVNHFSENNTKCVSILPEAMYGAEGVRQLVERTIVGNIPTVFVTRYSDVVNSFANAVAEGRVVRDDFLVLLVRYENHTLQGFFVSEHKMSEDLQIMGNDWPFGILW